MKTISFFNLKGGCGKTTSAVNLGYLLAKKLEKTGEKLLYIDCDMQSNLTNSLMDYDLERPCIYHLFTDDKEIKDVIYPVRDNIALIPSSLLMATVEPRLAGMVGREFILKRKIAAIADQYAYCIVDCSPSFSIVTTNAIIITDKIFIPVQTEYYAVDGVHLLEETLGYINQSLGIEKTISLLFATLHDTRNNINKIQYDNLKNTFGKRFMDSYIRKNISLVESPIFKQSIFEYKPRAKGAEDYKKLFNEIESKGGF
ncbi:MAG: ParA family protein [Eubacteriaceae bacterium]|nr:ParA family protein [Eubacteriaceae bacterium]